MTNAIIAVTLSTYNHIVICIQLHAGYIYGAHLAIPALGTIFHA